MTESEYVRGYRDALDAIAVEIKANPLCRPEPPARIPEPGLWGVVRASLPDDTTVFSWVHIRGSRWYTEHHGVAAWDVLVYPTLERDGIES
jgi:hypothetical protein